MPVGLSLELRLGRLHIFHLLAQLGDLVLQPIRLGPQLHRLRAACGLQRIQVELDIFLKFTSASFDLALGVVRSRLLTDLNFLPSMATTVWVNNLSSRHKPTKPLHALRMPLSLTDPDARAMTTHSMKGTAMVANTKPVTDRAGEPWRKGGDKATDRLLQVP